MRRLTLHIGWPKTGTSALQALLARNAPALRDQGVLYPEVERWELTHHRACGHLITHDDPLIPPPAGTLREMLDHLDAPQNAGVAHVVLSSEGFCRAHAIKGEAAAEVSARFEVHVLACLRAPAFWANSLLNEFAKSRLMLEGSVDLAALGRQMVARDVHYGRRLAMWADAFGAQNIHVVTLNEDDDFVALGLAALGVDGGRLPAVETRSRNASYGLASLQLLAWLARTGRLPDIGARMAINRRLRAFEGDPVPNLLDAQTQRMISEATPSICAELSRDWLGGRPAFAGSRALGEAGSADRLDSPHLPALAREVFADDAALQNALARDMAR